MATLHLLPLAANIGSIVEFFNRPLGTLVIGLLVVVGMILVLRMNAFLSLITAALVISLRAPGELTEKIPRVAEAFGTMAGKIGIVIAMAAIIGRCLMDSGAADRIIRAFARLFGAHRVPSALVGSGFVLSVPVFFDTVFYLLVPLARSFYEKIGKNYMLCLMATAAGAMITHTLVPPTPGPLIVSETLGVSFGNMMLVGGMIGVLLFPVGLLACHLINWYLPNPSIRFHVDPREEGESSEEVLEKADRRIDAKLPPLWLSLLPVLLPVVLISSNTIMEMWLQAKEKPKEAAVATMEADQDAPLESEALEEASSDRPASLQAVMATIGNKDLALILAAAASIVLLLWHKKLPLVELNRSLEMALMDGGIIILITAAGGAFGQMLQEAGVGGHVSELIGPGENGEIAASGIFILMLAFGLASAMKISLGSSTTSMITTSAIIASMGITAEELGCHPAYLCAAIGSGSLVFSWMNDSGFWLFCRMGGISETDTLKSWTILHILMGVSGFVVCVVLSRLIPLV